MAGLWESVSAPLTDCDPGQVSLSLSFFTWEMAMVTILKSRCRPNVQHRPGIQQVLIEW